MKRSRAFTLVEVALALGVIAFALVAVVGMIPTALQSARDAVDLTRTSMIAQDAAMRLPTLPFTAGTPGATITWYYDQNGHYLTIDTTAASPYASGFYRVDVVRGSLNSYPSSTTPPATPDPSYYPANTDPTYADTSNTFSTKLLVATATITWPLNPASGATVGGPNKKVIYPLLTRVVP